MIYVNGVQVEQNHFPDETLFVKLPEMIGGKIIIHWQYENDAELFTLICIRRHYSNFLCELYMPYIPHARMDRVKAPTDVFTLKYFCEVINSLNFDKVSVMDAHSNVSLALLNNVEQKKVEDCIWHALRLFSDERDVALFFPDEGSMKRYGDYHRDYPFAFGMKKRDWATGKILGLELMQKENIIGKDVLIIDDICSRGGTFYHSAKALKEAGAKSVSLYVTHCENTILDGEIFKSGLIDQIYTTRSLVHCDELKDKIIYV